MTEKGVRVTEIVIRNQRLVIRVESILYAPETNHKCNLQVF